jgi:hypothetical protein
MSHRAQAILIGVAAFVIGLAISIAIFVALDVRMIFIVGPAIGIGYAAYTAYRTAADDRST